MRHISTILFEMFDDADFVLSPSATHGALHSALLPTAVPSGFSDLDHLLAGLQRSDLIVVAGVPQAGKTSFALGIAYGASICHGKSVGYFSLQNDRVQMVRRLLAMEAGVEVSRIAGGDLQDSEWERLSSAFGRVAESALYVNDSAAVNALGVRVEVQRLKKEHGLDLVIIDDLQLLSGRASLHSSNRQDDIVRDLKSVAKDFDIPVVLISQTSTRYGNGPIPLNSKSIDCESIEEVADVVLLLQREELFEIESERRGVADIQVIKHRHGPVGSVNLRFFHRTARFADLELYPEPGM